MDVKAAEADSRNLRAALEKRTPIDVACGIIMAQNKCSYDEAFGILARASSHRNVKVRAVAETIVQDLPGGSLLTHFRY